MKKNLCAVCRVMLQDDNTFSQEPNHFSKVCVEHKEYATTFLTDVVAENLGFKDIEHDRECAICKEKLTDKEVQDSLKENSFHFLCEKHLKKYASHFQLPNDLKKQK